MRGLYVHVPFCVRKCAYCDFYSVAGQGHLVEAYVDALLAEAASRGSLAFSTLFIGGGTPSLLGAAGLASLMNGLGRLFGLSGLVEASIEVNPESAHPGLLQEARRLGIDRVSFGVQSLWDSELQSVGRVHTAVQAVQAIEQATAAGFENISADVIIGLPGQTWLALQGTLDTLTRSGVLHLSAYCLSLEPGTPLAEDPPCSLPPDDTQAELFQRTAAFLGDRGFVHYEISNFARPGYECRHNLNYWRGGEYLGLGPAAASHLEGRRFRNRADLTAYLTDPIQQVEDVEELGGEAKAGEEAMLRLRLLREGVDAINMEGHFGPAARGVLSRLESLAGDGQLVCTGNSYRLPADRVLTCNPILARVLTD